MSFDLRRRCEECGEKKDSVQKIAFQYLCKECYEELIKLLREVKP
jgi:predicted nucleic acid-binding Zn ribbon protein